MGTIVIIDDDPQSLEGMREAIPWNELNCEWVGEAQNGQLGLELIRELKPDIVITDIYMPIMNGLSMIEFLRAEDYQGKIIILSGYSDFEFARKALRLQVDDYMSKPVTVEEIVNVLKRAISALEEESITEINELEIRKKLMLFEPFVVSEWIKSVVSGTYITNEIHQQVIESLQMRWDSFSHMVLGIEINQSDRPDITAFSDWSLIRFAIGNMIQEILEEVWPESQVVELHGQHLAIVLHRTNYGMLVDEQEKIVALGHQISVLIEQYLNIRVRIGMGQIKETWQEISDSAEEAFQAIRAEYNHTNGVVVTHSFKFNQQLTDAILNQNVVLAEKLVRAYSSELLLDEDDSPWQVQSLAKDLWSTLSYSLFLEGESVDHLYQQNAIYTEIQSLQAFDQLITWILGKIVPLCSRPRKDAGFRHNKTVEFMMGYAHEHYAHEITLDDLSSKLFLSRNYLNKIFKQGTGETFTSYVIRVRMEKAKSLIIERKHLIYEIAEMVGYKNIPYFSSVFKKHFGKNPSDL